MVTTFLDEESVKKVIRQVEFYFREDGMISLALICSFTRMRAHLGLGDKKQEDFSEDTVKAVAETFKDFNFPKMVNFA